MPLSQEEHQQIAEVIGRWDQNYLTEILKQLLWKSASASMCKHKSTRSQWETVRITSVIITVFLFIIKPVVWPGQIVVHLKTLSLHRLQLCLLTNKCSFSYTEELTGRKPSVMKITQEGRRSLPSRGRQTSRKCYPANFLTWQAILSLRLKSPTPVPQQVQRVRHKHVTAATEPYLWTWNKSSTLIAVRLFPTT